jgi:hypothetical protein
MARAIADLERWKNELGALSTKTRGRHKSFKLKTAAKVAMEAGDMPARQTLRLIFEPKIKRARVGVLPVLLLFAAKRAPPFR